MRCLSLNLGRGSPHAPPCGRGRAGHSSYQESYPKISPFIPQTHLIFQWEGGVLNPDQFSFGNLPLVLGLHWGGGCLLDADTSNLTTCHSFLLVGVFLWEKKKKVADENVYDTNGTDDFCKFSEVK